MMKKIYLLLSAVLLVCCTLNLSFAQTTPKKVLYITEQKTMDASISGEGRNPITLDPIIKMLQADPLLSVTVKVLEFPSAAEDIAAYPIPEIATHDVIVIQESIGGNRNLLKPGGTLALANLNKPTLYNKNFAFSNNRAVGGNANSADVSTAGNPRLALTVSADNRSNFLFNGITFSGTEGNLPIFKEGATDLAGDPGTGVPKGFSYNNSVVMLPANRPLATFPANGTLSISETGTPIFFNDVAAGTTLTGSTATSGQILQQRVIFFGMNFGAMSRNFGSNMTSEGFTMWRNAIYSLAGLTVPNTLVNASLITNTKPEVANAIFNLGQNYPNPSNGSTTIQFELKKASPIALELFDITGRKVAKLAEGNRLPGAYEVKVDNNLKSGVYFYRLSAEGATATRTMVVSR